MCAFFWIPQTGNFTTGAYVKKRPSYTGSVPNLQVYLSLLVLDLFQKHPKLRCSSCNYAGFHLYPLVISSMDFWKIQQIGRWVSHLYVSFSGIDGIDAHVSGQNFPAAAWRHRRVWNALQAPFEFWGGLDIYGRTRTKSMGGGGVLRGRNWPWKRGSKKQEQHGKDMENKKSV